MTLSWRRGNVYATREPIGPERYGLISITTSKGLYFGGTSLIWVRKMKIDYL